MPYVEKVIEVALEHKEVVSGINNIDNDVKFMVDELICPGKADIRISYSSNDQRMLIEKMINGDTFFGVPYQLRNV